MNTYLAVDFGGGSGRVMAGSICQGTLKLEEVYRFPNRQVRMGNHVYWDFLALFDEMKNGLRQAVRKGYHIRCVARTSTRLLNALCSLKWHAASLSSPEETTQYLLLKRSTILKHTF